MPSRTSLTVAACVLIAAAAWSTRLEGGQGAVSWSLDPAHEDLTFWVNHDGWLETDFEGEVGFGDLARVLMRRRSNRESMALLRDRFVFRSREFPTLQTPDLLHDGATYVAAAGRVLTIPAIVEGRGRLYRLRPDAPGRSTHQLDGRRITVDARPLVRLRVEIVDETGRPTPARVYLTGADGLGYAPKGTISRFAALPAEQYFHAPPEFEIDLPAGRAVIEATRGIEYRLARREVDLRQPQTVRLRLERWTAMAARGWYSSDSHIHANYTAPHHQVVTPADALLSAQAEDLLVPNMVIGNSSGAFLHDRALFEGKLSRWARPPFLLYWNEEMRNAGHYGHMCFYGLKDFVEPAYTGFRDTPYADDYPPNYAQAKAAHDQGGAVTYAHPGYAPTFDGASMREMPVDAALGVIHAMDVLSNNPEEVAIELWYKLLSAGLRIGISAGTDSFTNVADHYTPGAGRVYARIDGELTYDSWLAAYKAGRTMATNGPMVSLEVNGAGPGSELRVAPGETLRIKTGLESAVPTGKLELIVNGKVLSPAPATLKLDASAWIAARVNGPAHRLILNDTAAFAHTSPVYVLVGNRPIRSADAARFWLDWIDRLSERVATRGRFSTPERREEVLNLFKRSREFYSAQLP